MPNPCNPRSLEIIIIIVIVIITIIENNNNANNSNNTYHHNNNIIDNNTNTNIISKIFELRTPPSEHWRSYQHQGRKLPG